MESQPQNDNDIQLSAIVLAGGQSSRMGQDKALIPVGAVPMLVRVCRVALASADSVYVVTPWIDRYQGLLHRDVAAATDRIHLIQERFLSGSAGRLSGTSSDTQLPQGPLVGFAQGLAHIQTDWALLLACDLPHLQAEVIQQWVAMLPNAPEETIAWLPKNPQGWWEALCGFYRRQCLHNLESFIQDGGRSFQHWLSKQSVQELPLSTPQMLLNCNTPADVERARGERD